MMTRVPALLDAVIGARRALRRRSGAACTRVEDHEQGGCRHGERHDGDEQARLRGIEQGKARREGDQHEGEFAALRQREGEARGIGRAHAEEPREQEQHDELHHDEAEDEAEHQQRLAQQQREVDARTDRDEEHREQQALERLEIHLELVAVFALGQHDAGEEGAERRREADLLHEQRDADHHDQRQADEDLAHAGAGDEAEQRAHEEAAGQHHRGDRGEHGQGLRPAGQIADQRGVMRVMRPGPPRAAAAGRGSGSPRCPGTAAPRSRTGPPRS